MKYLFRGKRKDNGEFIYGLPIYGLSAGLRVYAAIMPYDVIPTGEDKDEQYSDVNARIEVEEDTITPFIGITDKNGNKIYEGDIARFQFEEEEEDFPPEHLTVYYDEKVCSFLCRSDCTTIPVECDALPQGEIVGNVFDKRYN